MHHFHTDELKTRLILIPVLSLLENSPYLQIDCSLLQMYMAFAVAQKVATSHTFKFISNYISLTFLIEQS